MGNPISVQTSCNPHLPHVGLPCGAIQQHSKHLPSSWMRLNQKKLLSPKRSRHEWCPDQNQVRSTNLFVAIFGSPDQNLPLKPQSCHPSPSTGWCILVLSTWGQLGPSERILAAAAAFPDWCMQKKGGFKPWLETYWPLPTWRGFFANWINFLTISQVISYTV